MNKISFILFFFLFQCCANPAKNYLDSALDIMEKNSVNRKSIDWKEFKHKVHEQAKEVKTIEDTYPIIEYALWLLKEPHSTFLTPEQYHEWYYDTISISKQIFQKKLINKTIGYIRIPDCYSGNDSISYVFAKNIKEIIEELDKVSLTGWIIDLRDNRGGNMWPMLLGIGPVLGNGIAGYFAYPDSSYLPWSYVDGLVGGQNHIVLKWEVAYHLKNEGKKIAVLINNNTMSGGEAIVVSFKGLPNTRFFGENTVGLSTGKSGFKLSNGAFINLTASKFADRNKTIYGEEIKPDERIQNPNEVLKAAVNWIKLKI